MTYTIWDEKGFMLGVSASAKVIVRSDTRNRFVTQAGDRSWVTAIECVSASGKVLPPMIIFKGEKHLTKWYDRTTLLEARIGISSKGWTDNELTLDWLMEIFHRYTMTTTGVYRLLLLDGHNSHVSAPFIKFCLDNNIVALCLPAHSTHLLQPLDVGLFSPLEHYYGRGVDDAVRLGRVSITKEEFFTIFHQARKQALTSSNIQSAFRTTGLVPFDPQRVLVKLPNNTEGSESPASSTRTRPYETPKSSAQLRDHLQFINQQSAIQQLHAVSLPDCLESWSKDRTG